MSVVLISSFFSETTPGSLTRTTGIAAIEATRQLERFRQMDAVEHSHGGVRLFDHSIIVVESTLHDHQAFASYSTNQALFLSNPSRLKRHLENTLRRCLRERPGRFFGAFQPTMGNLD